MVYNHNDGLPNNFIRDIVETENGEFWIGCYNGGIVHFDGVSFKLHNEDIPSTSIQKLLYHNGLLYVGTDQDFFVYDGKKFVKNDKNLQVLDITIIDETIFVSTLQEELLKIVFSDPLKLQFSLERQFNKKSICGIRKYLDKAIIFGDDSLYLLGK